MKRPKSERRAQRRKKLKEGGRYYLLPQFKLADRLMGQRKKAAGGKRGGRRDVRQNKSLEPAEREKREKRICEIGRAKGRKWYRRKGRNKGTSKRL